MNANEFVAQARYGVGVLLSSQERLDFEVHAGAGIPTQQGATRGTLGGRVSWRIGAHYVALEGHGAVVGNPYQIRSFIEYGFRYR